MRTPTEAFGDPRREYERRARERLGWELIADVLSSFACYYVTEDEYQDGPEALIRHTAEEYRRGLGGVLGHPVLDEQCVAELQGHAARLRRHPPQPRAFLG